MNNLEKMSEIFNIAEKEHINLFHDISKEEFYKEFDNTAKIINNCTKIQFDYEMKKLFTLFKDAHTNYFVPCEQLSCFITEIQNEYYLKSNKQYYKITNINNVPINEIVHKISKLETYESIEWLRFCITRDLNDLYTYKMIGVANENDNSITINCENDFTIQINQRTFNTSTSIPQIAFYEYKILENNTLYIRYLKCKENENYPFKSMVDSIKKEFTGSNFILDLRNNMGGHSEIINPLQEYLMEKNMNGCILINNGVFSSGRFAVARFKNTLNVTTIGSPTGGTAKSYGNPKTYNVEDSSFCCSQNLWDFSNIFGYDGSIQPDIPAENTIDDLKNKNDRVLDLAKDYIQSSVNIKE